MVSRLKLTKVWATGFISAFLLTLNVHALDFPPLQWLNPLPTGNTMRAVAYGNGVFVAVGDGGSGIISTDGYSWAAFNIGADSLYTLNFVNGLFFASGVDGAILTSTNGTNWTARTSPAGSPLKFAYGNGFYLTAADNHVFRSTNGIDWQLALTATTTVWGLSYGNGVFVATSGNLLGGNVQTTLDGINWSNVKLPTRQTARTVTFGNGKFVAGGSYSVGFPPNEGVFISTNGTDWTLSTYNSYFDWASLCYGNGVFIGVGDPTALTCINCGADATNWRFQYCGSSSLRAVTFGAGKFVVVGDSGTLLNSIDGTNWVSPNQPLSSGSIRYTFSYGGSASISNTTVVVTGGNVAFVSTNNEPFSAITPAFSAAMAGVAANDSTFVAAGDGGTLTLSSDGLHWTNITTSANAIFYGISLVNSNFVGVGASGELMTSVNAKSWTSRFSGTTRGLHSVTYGAGQYVVVGEGGVILTSPDLATWTSQNSGAQVLLYGIAYGNGAFVAVAYEGKIFRSINGVDWSQQNSPSVPGFGGVVFADGLFVAAGQQGALLTSMDGITWNRYPGKVTLDLSAISFNHSRFLLNGANGSLLQWNNFPHGAMCFPTVTPQGFGVTFAGLPGSGYRFQRSSNLLNWVDLLSFTNNQSVTQLWDTAVRSNQFYRVVSP